MTFEEWKARFDKEITVDNIKVDWDSGHAYHYMDSSPACKLLPDFEDECEDYISEFMSECGPILYCVPWIEELHADYDRVCCEDCQPDDHDELVDFVGEYLALVKRQHKYESNFIVKLEQWRFNNKLKI